LECADRGRLKPEVGLEVLGDFPDKALKWEFANQQFSRFLIPTDFS
jgi:hypothetical protein